MMLECIDSLWDFGLLFDEEVNYIVESYFDGAAGHAGVENYLVFLHYFACSDVGTDDFDDKWVEIVEGLLVFEVEA